MAEQENRIYQTDFRENNFLGGRLKIASMPILTSVFLAPVFHSFKEKYPYVTIELMEGSSKEICKAVANHQVDFGFTASPFEDLDSKILLQDHMVAISKHKLATQNAIDLTEQTMTFLFCIAGFETSANIWKAILRWNQPIVYRNSIKIES